MDLSQAQHIYNDTISIGAVMAACEHGWLCVQYWHANSNLGPSLHHIHMLNSLFFLYCFRRRTITTMMMSSRRVAITIQPPTEAPITPTVLLSFLSAYNGRIITACLHSRGYHYIRLLQAVLFGWRDKMGPDTAVTSDKLYTTCTQQDSM